MLRRAWVILVAGLLPGIGPPGARAAEPPPTYRAVPLDREGKLPAALPLYRARAEQTLTMADRLRYAGALLRAGQVDEAKGVYAELRAEKGSVEHGDGDARNAAVCASSLLAQGFPALAVEFMRPVQAERPDDPTLTLVLVRALAAAGDAEAARGFVSRHASAADAWVDGQRIELARWSILTGDVRRGERLLAGDVPDGIGQLFRDSILANVPLQARDWARGCDLLASAARQVPPTLGRAEKVDRAWRNAQRELWSVALRRAICLWRQDRREAAAAEATKATSSDEEYVRGAALVLLVAADLVAGRRAGAIARLEALAGHDQRFAGAVGELAPGLASGRATPEAVARVREVLASEDRSADLVTGPLGEILAEAARPEPESPPPERTARRPG